LRKLQRIVQCLVKRYCFIAERAFEQGVIGAAELWRAKTV